MQTVLFKRYDTVLDDGKETKFTTAAKQHTEVMLLVGPKWPGKSYLVLFAQNRNKNTKIPVSPPS